MEQQSTLSKIFKIAVILDLIALNVFVVYLVNKPQPVANPQVITQQVMVYPTPDPTPLTTSTKTTPTPTPTPVVIYKTTTVAAPKAKVRSVYYVSVPGAGSTTNNDWADLAGTEFYFNTADYPGLVEIYFEVNAHLMNGNGATYVRLLDATHGIGVQGSDVQTSSQISTLVTSGKVSFWAGKNLIRVQAKSLTADTAIFDSGRLRIVTEN